jgi:hypothetical protein
LLTQTRTQYIPRSNQGLSLVLHALTLRIKRPCLYQHERIQRFFHASSIAAAADITTTTAVNNSSSSSSSSSSSGSSSSMHKGRLHFDPTNLPHQSFDTNNDNKTTGIGKRTRMARMMTKVGNHLMMANPLERLQFIVSH